MSEANAILAANLASPGLAHLRGVVSLDAVEKWRVEWSEPFPSLSLEVDGKWLSLGSRRAPAEEARTQIEEARKSDPWPPLVVLVGVGLGFAVDAIEEAAPPETRVLAIEPFAPAAAAMLGRRDWRRVIEDGRLHVVVGPKFGGAGELWRRFDPKRPPLVVEHPVLARARPDAIAGTSSMPPAPASSTGVRPRGRQGLTPSSQRSSLGSDPLVVKASNAKKLDDEGLFARLAALRDDQPPLSDWIASYARSLDRAMLDTALGQYAQYIGRRLSSGDARTDAGAEAPAYVPVVRGFTTREQTCQTSTMAGASASAEPRRPPELKFGPTVGGSSNGADSPQGIVQIGRVPPARSRT